MLYKELHTLGYSGLSLDPVKQWLDVHDVVLVDIRYSPQSRNPQWRQPYLQRVLGPRYRWVREFGNRNFRGGPIQLVNEPAGVRIVKAIMESNSVVLTCICADHNKCHRSVAATAIRKATGASVIHLTTSDFGRHRQLELL